MDGVLNGEHNRGQEIHVGQSGGRDIVITSRGKEILRANGDLLIMECIKAMGTRHSRWRDLAKELGG